MVKKELGMKTLVDTFIIDKDGIFVEMDGIHFDSKEYDSLVDFLQDIVDRTYRVAMGEE